MNFNFSKLNDSNHTFIIAEAGSNWKCGTYEEDLEQASKLIKIAAEKGADAVKFQTYKAKTTYVTDAGKSQYLLKKGIKKDINEIFAGLSMPYEMIPELNKLCAHQKIIFMSTPFSVSDAKQIDPFVSIHKLASFEINHVRLLEFLAKTGKPILISTGASTYDEIDFAVDFITRGGNNQIVLLQCTSSYPCPIEAMNLAVIPKLKEKYRLPIGLSDHSLDPVLASILAMGFGATVIEKHFTSDKHLPGPDHQFALNPDELEQMITSIRKADLSKGKGIKEVLEQERELRNFAKRSLQATHDIKKGEIFQEGKNFDVLRPGNRVRGLDARFLTQVNGKKATNDIPKGDGITEYE